MCGFNNLRFQALPPLEAKLCLFLECTQGLGFSRRERQFLMLQAMELGPKVGALEREQQIVGELWQMTCYIVAFLLLIFLVVVDTLDVPEYLTATIKVEEATVDPPTLENLSAQRAKAECMILRFKWSQR